MNACRSALTLNQMDEKVAKHFGIEPQDRTRYFAVTDDKSLDKAERKLLQIEHAAHASPRAKLVKLADKTCNLRDIAATPPADWSDQRRREYFDWAKKVVACVRGSNAALDAAFDTAAMANC